MFERFTDRARRVIVLAQEEARQLQHNYIGTEHILLGVIREGEGLGFRALERFGFSLAGTQDEARAIVGIGSGQLSGHIPFTPRAKKTLELALREALQLQHDYIGTEHILLGVIREGDGVGAQILRQHSPDLNLIRATVLDLLGTQPAGSSRRWLRRRSAAASGEESGQAELRTTPAADTSLNEAARLAGAQPVGSHHLLLASLSDPRTAAARALATLGVDLDQAREALRQADVTGTSDELPEEAGRRQMLIRVTDKQLTLEASDQEIIGLGQAALAALGDQASPAGTIRGDLSASASLNTVWLALHNSLGIIAAAPRPATPRAAGAAGPEPRGSQRAGPQPAGAQPAGAQPDETPATGPDQAAGTDPEAG